jgi:hypothetical protein
MAIKKKAQPIAERESITPPEPELVTKTSAPEVSPDDHSHQGCNVSSAGISLDISDHLN